mgnify:CR=1 FL=1
MNVIDKITTAVSEAIESALGVSLLDMVVQLLATVILVIIVRRFFWSKVTAFLDKRREVVANELANAEKASEEANLLKSQTESEANELRKNARNLLESARRQGEEERNQIIQSAKIEAKKISEEAKKATALDIEKAKAEVNNQAVELAALMASTILEKEIDPSTYADLASTKSAVKEN